MRKLVKTNVKKLLLACSLPIIRIVLQDPAAWTRAIPKSEIWQLAEAYDIKVYKHCLAQGQNPLVIEGSDLARQNQIPKSVYFNTRSGSIFVGKNTVFGEEVMVLTGKHSNIKEAEEGDVPLHHVPEKGRDIKIGQGCYIGSGAIILGGVSIGDYAVVGAGSVVTKDIASRAFVAGVPAKVIKML